MEKISNLNVAVRSRVKIMEDNSRRKKGAENKMRLRRCSPF